MIRFTINNNRTTISGDELLVEECAKAFAFKHPNAHWIRQSLAYEWDGKVWPVTKAGSFKTGFITQVIDWLSEWEEDYEILDHRHVPELLDIPYEVGGLRMEGKFAYQRDAIKAIVYNSFLGEPHPRGIIAAAVNAGKSTIMMGVHMSYEGARTLILMNNKVLYEQFRDDLAKAFPDDYGYMQGRKLKWGKIMVVMVQTLKNRLKEHAAQLKEFNILLTDECDLANNATFDAVYRNLKHISIRAGFTGTVFLRDLKKDKVRNTKMREIFGEAIFEIDPIQLEELGVSTETVVKSVYANPYEVGGLGFKEEFDELITHNEERHELIYNRLRYNLKSGRKHIMVFCKFIEQAEILFQYLQPKFKKTTINFTHHKRSSEEIIHGFRDGKINILITTLYLKRGMNFPLTEVIINASGGEFYSGPLQILGRGVRTAAGKTKFFYEDLYDEGKFLGKHSRRRIQYYKKVGYDVRFV